MHFVERADLMLSVLSTAVATAVAIAVTVHSPADSGARDGGELLEPISAVVTREESLDGVTAAGRLR